MFTERKVSVSISLYYFYLQFKLVFNLKSWKIWGRRSTKYIHLFFMPIFHCHPRILPVYARAFLDVPLQWMCCEGRASMPAVSKACLSMFAIIISAGQQQFPEDHKWKLENVIFQSEAGISKKSSAKFHAMGRTCFLKLRASSRSFSQLSVHSALEDLEVSGFGLQRQQHYSCLLKILTSLVWWQRMCLVWCLQAMLLTHSWSAWWGTSCLPVSRCSHGPL